MILIEPQTILVICLYTEQVCYEKENSLEEEYVKCQEAERGIEEMFWFFLAERTSGCFELIENETNRAESLENQMREKKKILEILRKMISELEICENWQNELKLNKLIFGRL